MLLLLDRLKSSAILEPPSTADREWFASNRTLGEISATGGDKGVPKPRLAALAAIVREVSDTPDGGSSNAEILLIKRAINPR